MAENQGGRRLGAHQHYVASSFDLEVSELFACDTAGGDLWW